jgi:tetratricopeptide (TPR) repeat protein
MARAMLEQSRFDDVEPWLTKAGANGAAERDVLLVRSALRYREGRDEDALAMCETILASSPDAFEATMRAANAERRMKRPEAAISRLAPFVTQPAAATVSAWSWIDLKEPAKAVAAIMPLLGSAVVQRIGAQQRSNLYHALGFAYESQGDYQKAIDTYTLSNEAIPITVDERAIRRDIDAIRRAFTAERILRAPLPSVRSARPVFVAAMPRSGTTLIDRIIAAHPLCGGAGETPALRAQLQGIANWPQGVDALTSADFDRIAQRYLAETDRYGPQAERIADKHLLNWTMVGLIAMAMPQARIIHLKRDTLDTGISCFERLRPGQVAWSRSLRLIGIALRACDVLMEHWHEVLATVRAEREAPAILRVQYETLVREPERETRRIVEFLGLPWDDACLAYHSAGSRKVTPAGGIAPPPTLSSEQASKPIYDSSIGRGLRFGAALDPLQTAYDEAWG